eukprot:CAMPEP_0114674852 /NCGR_PEP_ID=MMETSP0191-20121206/47029_1 /TAXON_ID=126664 /ORGANISM="Sorites sp." /LENGTH=157 /DNA_ID=CAMNT_0001943023 /DNA_START=65 /DNA_END=539 /DNA_ORIENTATION=-
MMRVLLFLASAVAACAFVQPAPSVQPSRSVSTGARADFATATDATETSSGFALALGASVGYAGAMAARGSSMMRQAENQPPAAVARTPVAYRFSPSGGWQSMPLWFPPSSSLAPSAPCSSSSAELQGSMPKARQLTRSNCADISIFCGSVPIREKVQ